MDDARRALVAAVFRLLTPLARIMLRHGLPFGSFAEIAKQAYVKVAEKDFALPPKKQSDSRIAVLTGLTRKEVKQFRQREDVEVDNIARYNRAARVISGWIQDKGYLNGWGEPALLPEEGADATFSQLVKDYGGDVPFRAVLDELLRVGAVERLEDGRLRLLQRAYVPGGSAADKLDILGHDVNLLLGTIEHNLLAPPEAAYFQRKVAYNNLPRECLPVFREMAARHGQQLLEELNAWLREQDRDSNPRVEGSGRCHAGLGIYYFQQDLTDADHEH